MFRDAAAHEAELSSRRLDQFAHEWQRTARTWFDNTPYSVDRRIAQLDRIISHAEGATARLGNHIRCANALPSLHSTRAQLEGLRERMLTGAAPVGLQLPREVSARRFEDFDDQLLTTG